MTTLVFRAIRPGLVLGGLLSLWSVLGVAWLVGAAIVWGSLSDPRIDPSVLIAGGLGVAGLLVAWAACSEVTLCAMRLLRDPRPVHPADRATAARWAARAAAVLIGLGAGQGVAHAAPSVGSSVSVEVGAGTAPQAGATGVPETINGPVAQAAGVPAAPGASGSPASAPDPRWGVSTGDGSTPEIALVGGRPAPPENPEYVVVRRGECLWDIVGRHLGPRASSAEIAAEWPRWYAANRPRIGSDPDLIRPGMRLHIPQARS